MIGFGGLTAAAALAGNGPASPVGGCPKGDNWDLRPLGNIHPEDQGNVHDQNGDGWICQFSNLNKNPSAFPDWIVKDNTNKHSGNIDPP